MFIPPTQDAAEILCNRGINFLGFVGLTASSGMPCGLARSGAQRPFRVLMHLVRHLFIFPKSIFIRVAGFEDVPLVSRITNTVKFN